MHCLMSICFQGHSPISAWYDYFSLPTTHAKSSLIPYKRGKTQDEIKDELARDVMTYLWDNYILYAFILLICVS